MFGTIGKFAPSQFGFSSGWLKEHSQLTGFNRMIASCLSKMAAKSMQGGIMLILCRKATD